MVNFVREHENTSRPTPDSNLRLPYVDMRGALLSPRWSCMSRPWTLPPSYVVLLSDSVAVRKMTLIFLSRFRSFSRSADERAWSEFRHPA